MDKEELVSEVAINSTLENLVQDGLIQLTFQVMLIPFHGNHNLLYRLMVKLYTS